MPIPLGSIGPGPLGDTTTAVVQQALKGLATRQRAIADNVANISTPGFRAQTVDFESSLRTALDTGDTSLASLTTAQSSAATRPDGNNVDLDEETLLSTKTNLAFQTMTQAMDAKLRLLKTAMENG